MGQQSKLHITAAYSHTGAAFVAIFKYWKKHYNTMVQKQIAFEKIKLQQEVLTLSDISPKWAKRLGEQQHLPVPLSITWLRWWFEIIYPPKCVVGEAHGFTRSYTYNCRECGKIGDKFSLYFTLHLYSKLQENKQTFVDHWNKEHTQFLTSSHNLGHGRCV